jgi:hypothetical protein
VSTLDHPTHIPPTRRILRQVEEHNVIVLSKTEGSTILAIELRGPRAFKALERLERTNNESLSDAVGHTVLDFSVQRGAPATPREATPGYKAI